jgi:predicted dehydrogenase
MRIAIIGTGMITENFIDAALGQDIQLEAVLSRDFERGKIYAEKHGFSRVFTDIHALAESDIEAVYIASPNAFHAPYAVELLKRGKHVLCEKPMAASLAEGEEMFRAADRGGAVLLEGMRSVHDPGFAKLREVIKTVGTVRRAFFTMCQYSSRYDNFRRGTIENAFNPKLANAAVMDIGVYCVSPMVRLFGLPESVTAASVFLPNGFEGEGTAILKYPKMLGEVKYSKITRGPKKSQIQGEDGTILIDAIEDTRRIEIQRRDSETEVYIIDKKPNNMYYEVGEFIRMVKTGGADLHREHTLNTLRVIDEIRRVSGINF